MSIERLLRISGDILAGRPQGDRLAVGDRRRRAEVIHADGREQVSQIGSSGAPPLRRCNVPPRFGGPDGPQLAQQRLRRVRPSAEEVSVSVLVRVAPGNDQRDVVYDEEADDLLHEREAAPRRRGQLAKLAADRLVVVVDAEAAAAAVRRSRERDLRSNM
eukprot:SAG11_NODE_55_length_19449_cov_28.630135_9_plen_160_part_00